MIKFKQLVVGIMIGVILSSCIPVLAENGIKTISVLYNNIKITVNGKEVKTNVEPFQYNGNTFVPVRFVSEALGANVKWNNETKTVEITTGVSSPTPKPTLPSEKQINSNITYEKLARNANDYIGIEVRFTGKVIQVVPGDDEVIAYRVNVVNENNNWSGTVFLSSNFATVKTRFLEDDIIEFTGLPAGYYRYKSVGGTIIEIPHIIATSITLNTSAIKNSDYNSEKIYKLGEEAPIYDKQNKKIGYLKIISVKETSERNKYYKDEPAQVIAIEYEYRNINSDKELYIHDSSHFQVIDEMGGIGKPYPNISTKGAVPIPKGSYCKAISHIGLENKSSFIKLNVKLNIFSDNVDIRFELPID